MIASSVPLSADWKSKLDLMNRHAPDVFEVGDDIRETPYADAVRTSLGELGLSTVFCVNGVPTIAIRQSDKYDQNEVLQIHAALWNQGLASILVIITGDVVRVFSLAKAHERDNDAEFEDHCLIETLDATASALQLQSLVSGAETGRLWHERREYFRPNERIDAVLLNNLEETHDLLTSLALSPSEAQAILIQTMFIAYLEDRNVIGVDYFQQATQGAHTTWSDLLAAGDVPAMELLFRQLRNDFNGDLFVAPCSFSEVDAKTPVKNYHLHILQRFRLGKEEMAGSGGQMRFWGYDFRYIPVELISAVYDRFLGHDVSSRKETGAFYTPMFLADSVVSSTWSFLSEVQKEKGTFFDPACGSGVFLVRSFQRLCEHWRESRNHLTIRWDSLQKMLGRIHGRDINSGAVRVAVFSLYLALLEQVSPPDLRRLLDRGRLLPPLWGRTLVAGDFFGEQNDDDRYDVIVGNPPWTSRRGGDRTAFRWSVKNGYPNPSKEEAWAFTWKALGHLERNGVAAFLLPAMGFLHNHSAASVAARVRLFEHARIRRVVNFSDLRFQLFEGAIKPAALLVFGPNPDPEDSYEFEYWTPKADLNLSIKRFITLSSADKAVLQSSEVSGNGLLFKHRLWMHDPDAKLFAFLSKLPRLSDFVEQHGTMSRTKTARTDQWVVGQGFQPIAGSSDTESARQSAYVGKVPHLPTESFSPIAIDVGGQKAWGSNLVRRLGFEQGFDGARVLVLQGVQTASWRLGAAYIDKPMTFRHSVQAIRAPDKEADQAKFLAAYLNSRLAVWFAFHGTGYIGVDRPKVQQAELLTLPLPLPDDLADPEAARRARSDLIALVDRRLARSNEILTANDDDVELREIDWLVYRYFGLTEDEIVLVEDAANYVFPAAQPHAGTYPEYWHYTLSHERAEYAESLRSRLSVWLQNGNNPNVRLVAKNLDFAILELSLASSRKKRGYTEDESTALAEVIDRLSKVLGRPINENFVLIPDLRLFVGECLYLIKPLQRRFWLRSTALADADSIAIDLETLANSANTRGQTA